MLLGENSGFRSEHRGAGRISIKIFLGRCFKCRVVLDYFLTTQPMLLVKVVDSEEADEVFVVLLKLKFKAAQVTTPDDSIG